MRALWVADAHLSDPSSDPYRSLQEVLLQNLEKMDSLVLLGDLFEIWIGDNPILLAKHKPLLDLLFKIRNLGKKIFYLKGNHDFLLGKVISKTLGAFIFEEEAVFQWDGYRFLASHGDQINKRDYGYRILKTILRSSWTERTIRALGDSKAYWAARQIARLAKGRSNEEKYRVSQTSSLRYARERLMAQYDAVILAHSHVLQWEVLSMEGKRRVYLNPGSWSDSYTYLWYDPGRFQIMRYQGESPKILFDFDFSLD